MPIFLLRIDLDDNIHLKECFMFTNSHTAVDIGISGSSISHTLVESSLWLGYRCGKPYVTTSSSSLRYDKYNSSSSVSKSLAGSFVERHNLVQ